MITRVHRRGSRVGRLLCYLWGPGKAEEHVNPHLVAAWDGAGPLTDLEPGVNASGKRDLRALTAMLEQPVRVGYRPPTQFVWHASMRLAPEDRQRSVSDSTWANIAVQMLTEVGVATTATDPGLRWIAMRHADDHIHIVATLVREDGRTNWLRNDYPRCVKATYDVARRYNLRRRVPPADRTAHRRPHPAEVSKARRTGRAQTPREELRRRVRTAVAAAGSQEEFFARLREAGILVRLRHSSTDPRQITGYAVALPGARTAGGQPVYFGGGRLAPPAEAEAAVGCPDAVAGIADGRPSRAGRCDASGRQGGQRGRRRHPSRCACRARTGAGHCGRRSGPAHQPGLHGGG
ncbi:hypothetical protein ACLQ26_20040 [Micromonospora sp. DT43]|uniref:hypothetical protein n=1 Tax=Micromonospora sp. DT43 TaxID=3393440 RepID=UPI003CF711F0